MTREMEEWAYYAMGAIHKEAQKDPEYQKIRGQWLALEKDYEAFTEGLSQQQRDLLTEYQCCVDNLHFQQVRVAYFLGKKHPGEFQK